MKLTPRRMTVATVAALAIVLGALQAQAQMGAPDDKFEGGLKPFGSFDGSDIDTINLTNLELTVRIPLIAYPQRGGELQFGFGLRYFPPVYTVKGAQGVAGWVRGASIIQGTPTFVKEVNYYSVIVGGNETKVHYGLYGFDGTSHWMGAVGSSYKAMDATGFTYDPASDVLTAPGGTRYSAGHSGAGATIVDTNGNEITPAAVGSLNGWTDTMGRVVAGPPSDQVGISTTDFTGCTGPLPTTKAFLWTVPGPGTAGTQITFKFCYAQGFFRTALTPLQIRQQSGITIHLQSVVLPNSTAWTFVYDDADPNNPNSIGYASLAQITRPTGGTISYSGWQQLTLPTFPVGASTCGGNAGTIMVPTQRTIDAHDVSGPQTWSYSVQLGDSHRPVQTTVMDPMGNETDHFFTSYGCVAYENETKYFQGSSTSGNL